MTNRRQTEVLAVLAREKTEAKARQDCAAACLAALEGLKDSRVFNKTALDRIVSVVSGARYARSDKTLSVFYHVTPVGWGSSMKSFDIYKVNTVGDARAKLQIFATPHPLYDEFEKILPYLESQLDRIAEIVKETRLHLESINHQKPGETAAVSLYDLNTKATVWYKVFWDHSLAK